MSSDSPKRLKLLQAVEAIARQSSAATVMFHQTVAERMGLSATEHKCADIIARSGQLTAGQLAELTGLTTGAITGIVDRLEKAGMVRRERDPADRRRVIITMTITPERQQQYRELFEPLAQATSELCATYSDRDLELIFDFMQKSNAMMHQQTLRLREKKDGKQR